MEGMLSRHSCERPVPLLRLRDGVRRAPLVGLAHAGDLEVHQPRPREVLPVDAQGAEHNLHAGGVMVRAG